MEEDAPIGKQLFTNASIAQLQHRCHSAIEMVRQSKHGLFPNEGGLYAAIYERHRIEACPRGATLTGVANDEKASVHQRDFGGHGTFLCCWGIDRIDHTRRAAEHRLQAEKRYNLARSLLRAHEVEPGVLGDGTAARSQQRSHASCSKKSHSGHRPTS